MEVIDLDLLRPEPQMVRLGNKDIDVSFVPCGITFDLAEVTEQLSGLDSKKMLTDRAEQKRGFDLGVKLCAIFCSIQYPEMDEKWIRRNASNQQVEAFAGAVTAALNKSYQGIEAHAKN